ncbi:hypothetical protein PoB_007455200 [Plakobranchus ocellatus]|uniref:Uncharacterized protein n=1 Tax=Plakobranchus ocellatus TaxID=259542 RepID=A0AAV4DUS4_9GAST|nr:hypothetical protein PoB_007455200 [Plakobranchus ocellatus]
MSASVHSARSSLSYVRFSLFNPLQPVLCPLQSTLPAPACPMSAFAYSIHSSLSYDRLSPLCPLQPVLRPFSLSYVRPFCPLCLRQPTLPASNHYVHFQANLSVLEPLTVSDHSFPFRGLSPLQIILSPSEAFCPLHTRLSPSEAFCPLHTRLSSSDHSVPF